MPTVLLSVSNTKVQDMQKIQDSTGLSAHGGMWVLDVTSIDVVDTDAPNLSLLPDQGLAWGPQFPAFNDSVPQFTITNAPGGNKPNKLFNLVNHPLGKMSGRRQYNMTRMIYAVNKGKIDANGISDGGANNPYGVPLGSPAGNHELARCFLFKRQDWPCDDTVQVTVNYTLTWTQKSIT